MASKDYAVVLLAAGASKRFGSPKQLLQWKGKSLLEHQVILAQGLTSQVLVVVGANADLMIPVLHRLEVIPTINHNWSQGMSSSLQMGLAAAQSQYPHIKGILVLLVDQPLVHKNHLSKIMEAVVDFATDVVASGYAHGAGVPAYLPQSMFESIRQLKGDQGARKLLLDHPETTLVDCQEVHLDIDTIDDWQRFLQERQ